MKDTSVHNAPTSSSMRQQWRRQAAAVSSLFHGPSREPRSQWEL